MLQVEVDHIWEKRLIVANAVRPFKEGNALANHDTLNQPSFSIKYAIKRLEGIKKVFSKQMHPCV